MDSDDMRSLIERNASEISRLHARINETVKTRSRSPAEKREWEQACAEFHARFDELAFPGGYDGALKRILAGDPDAVGAAVCFLEVRPYFFRSGYMFRDILKKARRAPLSSVQADRLAVVERDYETWRARRKGHEA
jgi:hypothetical protein